MVIKMSNQSLASNTLYLIQASYSAAPMALSKLQQLYTAGDSVVFMGDAVMHASSGILQTLQNCFVLRNEQPLLNDSNHQIQLIDYDAFATLCLQYSRCISLK